METQKFKFGIGNIANNIKIPMPVDMTEAFKKNPDLRVKPDGSLPMDMQNMPPNSRAMGYDGGTIGSEHFQMMNNPFPAERMNNLRIPDMPIQTGMSMAEQMLNDTEVPIDIREKYWFVFHKDNTLTFLDEERKRSKMLNFDIIKIDMMNTMPYYDYNFEVEKNFDILRNTFETKLDRALGFKGGNVKNERITLQSQFQEHRQFSETGNTSAVKEGFFKRLLGRR